jgi:hypothetical protein
MENTMEVVDLVEVVEVVEVVDEPESPTGVAALQSLTPSIISESSAAPTSSAGVSLSTVHHLPCSIDYVGPAPVQNYFLVSKMLEMLDDGKYVSHFRGRKLFGEKKMVPANLQGMHVQETHSSGAIPKWEVRGEFKEIIFWEHDRLPDASSFRSMVEWNELSSAVMFIRFCTLSDESNLFVIYRFMIYENKTASRFCIAHTKRS